jgi:hypothetical protein
MGSYYPTLRLQSLKPLRHIHAIHGHAVEIIESSNLGRFRSVHCFILIVKQDFLQ